VVGQRPEPRAVTGGEEHRGFDFTIHVGGKFSFTLILSPRRGNRFSHRKFFDHGFH
jgi:hypothetical protein